MSEQTTIPPSTAPEKRPKGPIGARLAILESQQRCMEAQIEVLEVQIYYASRRINALLNSAATGLPVDHDNYREI